MDEIKKQPRKRSKKLECDYHSPYIYRIDGKGEHHKCSVCNAKIERDWVVIEEDSNA